MRFLGYIIVLILVIIDLGVIFNFTLPKVGNLSKVYQNAKLKESEYNLYVNLEKKITEINLTAEKLKNYQKRAEELIPTEYRPEEYLVLLPNLFQDSFVNINSFSFEPVQGGVNISLNVSGSWSAINDFLLKIQNSRRILDVKNLSISGQGDSLNMSLSILSPTFK